MNREVRLVVGPAVWVMVFACVVVALLARYVLIAGHRPLGWALAAITAAAALEPLVSLAARHVRRGLALVIVLVPILALVGLVTWGAVRDLDGQVRQLKRNIPAAARTVERSERFGDAARDFDLTGKAGDFAASIRRPSSRVGEEARGGASTWVLTLILTVFALGWGPRFSEAALRQFRDEATRSRVARVVGTAFERSQVYVGVSVALALVVGLAAWVTFTLLDLPAPTPLALVVGAASIMPRIGIAATGVPIAVFSGVLVSPGVGIAVGVGAALVQIGHDLALGRFTRGAADPGAALIVISVILGYELYGVGGAVVAMSMTVMGSALVDALAQEEAAEREVMATAVASAGGLGAEDADEADHLPGIAAEVVREPE
ncbi:MAG: AI-2E family transporter [Acidimicrobiales bacterium]|nr:AI-2E family transporter [Acidimicrobiales bacterium]